MMHFHSRAAVRRALAQLPDAGRMRLGASFAEQAGEGPITADEIVEVLAAYLLDPRTGAILATSDDRAAWLELPLFSWVGPGNAAPLHDQIAALVVAPVLQNGAELSPLVLKRRFAPRADDLVALAVSALDLPAQATALEQLFGDPGPEPELLALSIVQCGRILAWAPHLLEWPIAEHVVTALIALLDPMRPAPLLQTVARALGPIAARPGPLPARVRAAALAGVEARSVRDPHLELPRREVASVCSYILGFSAPRDREAFLRHRALVIDRPDAAALSGTFVDGLVAAGRVDAISELVAALLVDDAGNRALAFDLAARLPLDPIGPLLLAQLDAPQELRRAAGIGAVELLETTGEVDVESALALRLSDPSPGVTAAATRTLLARGRRDIVELHAGRETSSLRRAIVGAGLGELTLPAIGELVRAGNAAPPVRETGEDDAPSPLTELLADALLGSAAGLELAADLIGGGPDAAGLLALASLPGTDRDIGVIAPPHARARFAQVTTGIGGTLDGEEELAALGLYLLARVSAGDEVVADMVSDALDATEGYAATLIAALGELRVANDRTAAALAPFLEPDQAIGGRVIAASVFGRAVPADHPAWVHVRELLELDTISRASAWTALRDRARRRV